MNEVRTRTSKNLNSNSTLSVEMLTAKQAMIQSDLLDLSAMIEELTAKKVELEGELKKLRDKKQQKEIAIRVEGEQWRESVSIPGLYASNQGRIARGNYNSSTGEVDLIVLNPTWVGAYKRVPRCNVPASMRVDNGPSHFNPLQLIAECWVEGFLPGTST